MAGLQDFRTQHPEYSDMSDGDLADALYRKFYFDIPRADFDKKMGVGQATQPTQALTPYVTALMKVPGQVTSAAQGIAKGAQDFFTLPGRVAKGEVNPNSDEAGRWAFNAALSVNPATPAAQWARTPRVPVPSSAELKASGAAGRDAARGMGVEYDPQSILGLASTTQQDLMREGLGPRVASQTNGILDDLQKIPNDPTAGADFTTTVEAARKSLQNIAQGAVDASDRAAASRAIARLDEFIKNPPSGSVVAGASAPLGETFTSANADYAAGSRSQTLEAIAKRSQNQTSASNSGLNLDNTVRQKLASFIAPPIGGGPSAAVRSGFTESEVQLLQDIVDGKKGANALRGLSNLLGGGGGLGALVSGGIGGTAAAAATGNPAMALLGLAPPAVGVGAKLAENAVTRKALTGAAEELRRRSASYRAATDAAKPIPTNPAARARILQMMLLGIPHEPPPNYLAPNPLRSTAGQTIPAGTQIY